MKKIFLIAASPINYVPLHFNVGDLLASSGLYCVFLGYAAERSESVEIRSSGLTIERKRLYTWRISNHSIRRILGSVEYFFQVSWTILRMKPDRVIAFNDEGFLLALLPTKLLTNAKLITWLLESYAVKDRVGVFGKMSLALSIRLTRLSDRVICPNSNRARFLQKQRKLPEIPMVVQNCPMLTAEKDDPANKSCEELRIKEVKQRFRHIVIYTGQVGVSQGFPEILQIADSLPHDAALVIFGLGTGIRKRLELEFGFNSERQNVFAIDGVPYDYMLSILRQADIGLVVYKPASLNEYYAAPGKLYEYLRAGLAIVGSNTSPTIVNLLSNFQCGKIIDPTDGGEMVKAIRELLSDEKALKDAKRNANNAFVEVFNLQKQMQTVLGYLKQ